MNDVRVRKGAVKKLALFATEGAFRLTLGFAKS